MNNRDSFWTNPQYRVRIEQLAVECTSSQGEKNMLVSLMQKPDKRNRRLVQNLHIGFSVFEVTKEYEGQKGKFPASFFSRHAPVAQTKTYMNAREVMEFFMLKPGEYLIVPSTFNVNETASFILTILSKAETHVNESSDGHHHGPPENEPLSPVDNGYDDEGKRDLFHRFSDKYEEVDSEKLQEILNEQILEGDLKFGGFSIDACRSMVALMDTSVTGKLNDKEFLRLMRKANTYKKIFYITDVSQTGTLSLSELRNAIMTSDRRISDEMLNLLAVRYGTSSGTITLQSFICLILRLDCMSQIFRQLSDGINMTLRESEWMYISMYT